MAMLNNQRVIQNYPKLHVFCEEMTINNWILGDHLFQDTPISLRYNSQINDRIEPWIVQCLARSLGRVHDLYLKDCRLKGLQFARIFWMKDDQHINNETIWNSSLGSEF